MKTRTVRSPIRQQVARSFHEKVLQQTVIVHETGLTVSLCGIYHGEVFEKQQVGGDCAPYSPACQSVCDFCAPSV